MSPTSLFLSESHDNGDAIISNKCYEIWYGGKQEKIAEGDSCIIKGLEPSTRYTCKVVATVNDKTFISTKDINTQELVFITAQPRIVSEGNVIVSAQTNLEDNEEVGFAWRRTDWTNDFESKKATAYLYEGTIEGIIHNLNTNYLWKYCPYFVSESGKIYYGKWQGIDPTDFSYFDPIVHTFSDVSVIGNTAIVRGSALQGTDNLEKQGFKLWPQELGEEIPDNSFVFPADGQMMSATIKDLNYETPYYYTAFVTTSAGASYYGSIRQFTTGTNINGIEDHSYSQKAQNREGVFSITGYKIGDTYDEVKNKLHRGVYIVNGKKVLIK